jgi:hypothetical protein
VTRDCDQMVDVIRARLVQAQPEVAGKILPVKIFKVDSIIKSVLEGQLIPEIPPLTFRRLMDKVLRFVDFEVRGWKDLTNEYGAPELHVLWRMFSGPPAPTRIETWHLPGVYYLGTYSDVRNLGKSGKRDSVRGPSIAVRILKKFDRASYYKLTDATSIAAIVLDQASAKSAEDLSHHIYKLLTGRRPFGNINSK